MLQLVDMGMCEYHELKDGTLNFRDVILLLEYLRTKDAFISWKSQRAALNSKNV